jgi:hypothetical protein
MNHDLKRPACPYAGAPFMRQADLCRPSCPRNARTRRRAGTSAPGGTSLKRLLGCGVPLHHADHHGDFIVVTDTDLGMGVPGGTEGAQVGDVLLKLGQGRATGKSPLVLACIFVLRSHRHHLRCIACPANAARLDPRARRRVLLVAASCAPQRHMGRAKGPGRIRYSGCWTGVTWAIGPVTASAGLVELGSAGWSSRPPPSSLA